MAVYDIESEGDSHSVDEFVEYEDRETLKRSRQSLGISVAYVPEWVPLDGFREIFQNWKDAIIETSKLERRKFRLVIKDLDGEYTAEARLQDSEELLGYLRYIEHKGTLELTNFGAQLSRKSLDLGSTSKRDKKHLAGTHGEGFKVAALVMARQGYQVRFEASSYYWSFRFGGPGNKHLYCHLSPISETKLKKQMKASQASKSQGFPRDLTANNWEDVTVRIGRLYGPQWGERIEKQQFLSWVKVAIDLDQPTKVFETVHGTLIQDGTFGNKVYLKGLLLRTTSSAKRFKFGYDLMDGAVNRDRQKLSDPGEEAKILANIWEVPIREKVTDAINHYVDMLLDKAQWGDVNRAESEISASTASLIWQHLLLRYSGKGYFYHGQDTADQDAQLIRKSLKKIPNQLPRCIWNPLRRFNLARTVQEERYHLLHNAPLSLEASTLYSAGVKRALTAALSVDIRTQNLEIVFKNRYSAELDLLLKDSQLQVNDKWLDFHASHKDAPCSLSRLALSEELVISTFSCDHVINELYDLVLVEINKQQDTESGIPEEKESSLRLRVSDSLRHMPRMIDIIHGDNDGEILVSWTDTESSLLSKLYHLDLKCRVTLHRESTCSQKRFDLVGPQELSESEISISESGSKTDSDCGCPEKVVLQKDSRVIFDILEHDHYFPMIARTHSQAFYGLPPKALQITDRKALTETSNLTSTTSVLHNNHNYARHINESADVGSDASSGQNIPDGASLDIGIDSTTRHPSIQSSSTSVDILGVSCNAPTSSSSIAQQRLEMSPAVEARSRSPICTTKRVQMFRSNDETQRQRTKWFTEVLVEKDKLIQNAKTTIERLEIRDQDANGSIEDLRIKIQQLQHENSRLITDRDQAQDDFSTALSLAHNAVMRYRHSATTSKRESQQLDHVSTPPESLSKKPRLEYFHSARAGEELEK